MRIHRSLVLCAAIAFVSAGCEVHEHERDAGFQAQVGVDVPQGAVIQGPGVVAVDTEPDPSQRVYVYDEGFPPGTFIYDNYYYYNGYRYPRDVFVNQYVQANIRQHRFVNADDNRRQGQQIEQNQRAQFQKTHGVRQNAEHAQPAGQTPARQPEIQRPNVQAPDIRVPANEEHRANVEQPEKRTPTEAERTNVQRPENKTPAAEDGRANGEHPEDRTPANQENRPGAAHPENKLGSDKQVNKPAGEEPKREEAK